MWILHEFTVIKNSIIHEQLYFDLCVWKGGGGVYIVSRNEKFPKRPFSKFPPIKNSPVIEKIKRIILHHEDGILSEN